MKKLLVFGGAVVLLIFSVADTGAQTTSEAAAMKTLDEFMTAFNARDAATWSTTLNYPHVRLASGGVRVWDTAQDYAGDMDFDRIAATGWHHSVWKSRKVVQQSSKKVHIAVEFTRFDKDNDEIGTWQSLYIVTHEDGHWGVKARSSFLE